MDKNLVGLFGKKILDSIPPDALDAFWKPICSALGDGIGGAFFWIFHKPIEYRVIKEQELAKFTEQMAQGMNKIPEEFRDSSKLGLVIQTLQNSVYQLNKKDLQTMFAQLVVSLADKRENDTITPRYVYVLSQLGYQDVVFLKKLRMQNGKDVLHVRAAINNNDKLEDIGDYYLYFSETHEITTGFKATINVRESLGIIKEKDTIDLSLQDQAVRKLFTDKSGISDGNNITWLKNDIEITSFGLDFINTVVTEK